jgi:membrane fusion protein, adhesin transport system
MNDAAPTETEAGRLTSVSADLLEPPSHHAKWIIRSIVGAIAISVAWSYLTPVDEVAAGIGKVIPDKHVQSIQSVEGGYVVAILARSGDVVEKGQVIVRLDQSASGTSREEISLQLVGLKAAAARLRALVDGTELQIGNEIAEQHPSAAEDAKAQFIADRNEQEAALQGLASQVEQKQIELGEAQSQLETVSRAYEFAAEELKSIRQLRKSGAASRAEVLAAEQRHNEIAGSRAQLKLGVKRLTVAVSELQTRIAERESAFTSRNAAALNDTETRIAAMSASLAGQQSRVDRTEVRAPLSGVLKTVKFTNIGQVVKPYDEIAELVPESQSVIVQARIRPEDIGFVAKGHKAVIKLSAYDYSIFGAVYGTLVKIAADSTTDDRGQTYYAVEVLSDKPYIERRGERWPIKPGMVANVEIVTGTRTVFQYLTKPIHRMATMALRER